MNQHIVTLTQQLITLAEEANSIYDTVRENEARKRFLS